jgi:hypothetical protein
MGAVLQFLFSSRRSLINPWNQPLESSAPRMITAQMLALPSPFGVYGHPPGEEDESRLIDNPMKPGVFSHRFTGLIGFRMTDRIDIA